MTPSSHSWRIAVRDHLTKKVFFFNHWSNHLLPIVILSVAMLGDVLGLPYGYYIFTRWMICGYMVILVHGLSSMMTQSRAAPTKWLMAVLVIFAVIYNPFVPLGFAREVWDGINAATIALCAAMMIFIFGNKAKSKS